MTMIIAICLIASLIANLMTINRIAEKLDEVNDIITDMDMVYVRISKKLNEL